LSEIPRDASRVDPGREGAGGGAGSEAGSGDVNDTPRQIGPYRILRTLGEGGMGVVYEARQIEPVQRRVALKIIKLGMDTKQVVARFEAERQALAVMDHPFIAKVLDAGVTETGRPYFVMELVNGVPLTEYCDAQKLATDQRLELFIQVCAAVQHAHHKGVIHRDLKPSNVLVSLQDGKPVPRVIDFGIAKAVGQDFTDRTLVTQLGQMVGTPEYMSPEQAEMSGIDVDTRTDIYSLGVMLYELLVGALPFDLRGVSDIARQTTIRERNAPTPSARLTTLSGEQQETVARYRHTDPGTLKTALKGDLDWVVMRCLEKDRTRRYETVNALAMELGRHLDDQPVLARPPSTKYRLQKFVRRNRTAVIAACVAGLAISGGAVAATIGMVKARRAETRAERESATAKQVSEFLEDLFEVSDPNEALGNTITARELLDRGAARIEDELSGQPLVQARMMASMGEVFRKLGLYDSSLPLLERALALRERELGSDDLEVAASLHQLATLHRYRGEYDAAEELYKRALAIRERRLGPNDLDMATSIGGLAGLYLRRERYAEAEPLLRRELAIRETAPGSDELDMATTLSDLGVLYWGQGEYAAAEPFFERSVEIRESKLGPDDPTVASAYNNLGALYWSQGKYQEAEGVYEKARRIFEKTLGPEHPRVAGILNNLAETAWALKRYDEADSFFTRSLAIKERTLATDHPSVAIGLNGLANLRRDQGRFAEAESLYRRALDIRERVFGPDGGPVAETLEGMADLLRRVDRTDEADRLAARALDIRTSAKDR